MTSKLRSSECWRMLHHLVVTVLLIITTHVFNKTLVWFDLTLCAGEPHPLQSSLFRKPSVHPRFLPSGSYLNTRKQTNK